MTIEKFNGSSPSAPELSAAPIVDRWMLLSNDNTTIDISGFVTGHFRFRDGEFITTSALEQIDPSSPPAWVRTKNTVYRLGNPAGAVESQVRELARDLGVRPRAWDIVAYGAVIGELSGLQEVELDIIEQLIAVLYSHGHIKIVAAKILLTTYRKERAAC
ncbi:hypothetical protein [Agrobacterium pusense]|uniref:hypothetical protein n=1 Tax=Agrobacterium pusense TaxID=648995 RepID=UPI000D3D609E|nr:hypothetical protein [Agrobacterium pusense]PTV70192.1 hypothetical protein DBL06_25345 [Agrobacterium pusense]